MKWFGEYVVCPLFGIVGGLASAVILVPLADHLGVMGKGIPYLGGLIGAIGWFGGLKVYRYFEAICTRGSHQHHKMHQLPDVEPAVSPAAPVDRD